MSVGRRSRRKGAAFENEVAHAISDAMNRPVRRTLGQARDSGTDIHPAGYAVECKRYKSLPKFFVDALQQAIDGRKSPTDIPLVVARQDNGDAMAVLRFDDFLTMLAKVTKADDIFAQFGDVLDEIRTAAREDDELEEVLA